MKPAFSNCGVTDSRPMEPMRIAQNATSRGRSTATRLSSNGNRGRARLVAITCIRRRGPSTTNRPRRCTFGSTRCI